MIAGVTRVRNEEQNLERVLDHVSDLVDEVFAFDDFSTDSTPEILDRHPIVKAWKRGKHWRAGPKARRLAEGNLRQIPYEMAVAAGADWVYYFDGDEIADFEGIDFDSHINAYRLRLFDYYITPEDEAKAWHERQWMGPEFRDILMVWRVFPGIRFHEREPLGVFAPAKTAGWVKHYGKAISVEQWNEACDYYANERWPGVHPKLQERWEKRKGKAVHHEMMSDYGNPLIRWSDRRMKGIPNVW